MLFSSVAWAAASVRPSVSQGPKLPRDHLPVPIVQQATDYSCGAAALLAVLEYWNAYEGTESSLYPLLNTTPADGTEPDKIASLAADLGLHASYKDGMTIEELRDALDRGHTVILDIQAWHENETRKQNPRAPRREPDWREIWDDGHYVVLIAMDDDTAYFMDPSAGASYGFIPIPELLDRWHDYEDRNGRVWRYFNLGITIYGEKPIRKFPAPLVRIE